MKILAIGDFHGKFPKKLQKLANKVDLVVSTGDYPPFHYRKLWFKHCYGKEIELWEIIGKKKYKKLVTEDYNRGEKVLKKLNKLSVPVFTTLGNIDYPSFNDVADLSKKIKKSMPNWDSKELFGKRIKKYKNIKRFDYKYIKFKDLIFIGMRGHSFKGKVKSKAFKKHRAILDKLFKKFIKENKEGKVIFVSHTPPKDTKLDLISKKAHPKVAGTHGGSKLTRKIIESHQPSLSICGHTHESWGKDKIKKTLIVNTGSAADGKAAIIDIDKKIKVRFI